MITSKKWSKQAGLFLAVLVCTTLLWADDKPWKSKPYQAWDAKDVQTIMTESPWVHVTVIKRSWLPASHDNVPAPQQPISGGVRSAPSVTATAPGVSSGTTSEDAESAVQVNAYVYWDSSRVMRAATSRQRVLHGEMKDSEVEPYARTPQEEYQLVVSLGDMTPFVKADEKFFEANSSLEMKKGKLKLPPSHVVYQKDSNGILRQAVFFFPKKTASGAPTIGSDETDVEFKCKIADSTLKVDFKPQNMVDQSGPDL